MIHKSYKNKQIPEGIIAIIRIIICIISFRYFFLINSGTNIKTQGIIIIIILILTISTIKILNSRNKNSYTESEIEDSSRANENYRYKGDLLCKNEKIFYKKLDNILKNNFGDQYTIFCQVRMMDLFRKNHKNARTINLSLDYLIIDIENNFKPIVAIELDGNSHEKYLQRKHDNTKEELLSICGIDLIRIKNEDEYDEELIFELIMPYLDKNINKELITRKIGYEGCKINENRINLKNISNYEVKNEYTYNEQNYREGNIEISENRNSRKFESIKKRIIGIITFIISIFLIRGCNDVTEEIQKINENNQIIDYSYNAGEKESNNEKTEDKCSIYKGKNKTREIGNGFKCASNIEFNEGNENCIKYEICENQNNEKKYYITDLNEGAYLFLCFEDRNQNITKIRIKDLNENEAKEKGKTCNDIYKLLNNKLN